MNEELRGLLITICLGFISGSTFSMLVFDKLSSAIIPVIFSVVAIILHIGRRKDYGENKKK